MAETTTSKSVLESGWNSNTVVDKSRLSKYLDKNNKSNNRQRKRNSTELHDRSTPSTNSYSTSIVEIACLELLQHELYR